MTSVSHPRGPRPSPRGASRVIDGVLRVRRVGTRFARAWFALALAFPLMHCIVLDPTSSIPEPLPPVLSSPPSAAAEGVAMDQIIEVRRTDGDGQTDLQIPLVLTYADDRVDFRYRVFLDLQRGNEESAMAVSGGNIPGGQGSVHREFTARIAYDNLGGHGCHRLTIVATTEFANPGPGALPVEGEPAARAAFFVNVLEPLAEPPLVEDCPR